MVTMTQPRFRALEPRTKEASYRQGRVNVGSSERTASLLGGGLLALYGLTRGTTSGLLLAGLGGALAYRGATGHCTMYQALGISSAKHKPSTAIPSGQGVKIEESVTINKSADELFAFWRQLENLPRVMKHLVSVREQDARRSHWVAKGLTGDVEWGAEIINERPNELIAWKSAQDAEVETAGSVHFQAAPGKRGTEVKVVLSYNPPAGQVGAAIARLAGRDAQSQVREDLRAFKRLMETGTLPTTEGQPRGKCC
jgi:uncharacterized membrane protein